MKVCLTLGLLVLSLSKAFALEIKDRKDLIGFESEVTKIDLSNTGLSEFPVEILKCKNLIELDLSDNGIINLPIALSELTQLKTINLSGNQGVSYNDLDTLFEVAQFQLEELNLNDCELGFIPYQLGKQRQLKTLSVAGNLLNNLPYTVVQLRKLKKVDVSRNEIEDLAWQVAKWWNLKELDISDNRKLKLDDLFQNLSMGDGLDKLVVSHIFEFPRSFKDLDVKELEVRNSKVRSFLRTGTSTPIPHLSFVNCTFANPEKVVDIINENVHPTFIGLNKVSKSDLTYFLQVEADSVDLRDNKLKDISALAGVKKLKWADARGNNISEESRAEISGSRPDLTVLFAEPLVANRGIAPPIRQFVKKPIVNNVKAGESNSVTLGKATFNIAENSFLDASGNVYEGPVELSYTEYFEPSEIFLSGITMTSDSAGENLIFSSGGMFNLTASDSKGNELEMNPQAPIDVSLMSSDANRGMNLYRLDENGVWEYTQKDTVNEPFKLDIAKVDSAGNRAFLEYRRSGIIVTENRFVPVVKGDSETKSFSLTFDEYETNIHMDPVEELSGNVIIKSPGYVTSFIGKSTFIYDGERDSARFYLKWLKGVQRKTKKEYRKLLKYGGRINDYGYGVNYISKLNVVMDKQSDKMRLNLMYKDSLVSIPVVLKSNPGNPKYRLRVFQKFFKKYDRFMRRDEVLRKKRNHKAGLIIKKQENEVKEMAMNREKLRQQMYYDEQEFFKGIVDQSSVQRSFSLQGFGVWNCDQRQRMLEPAPLPMQFVDHEGARISDDLENVYVIDYDRNGVVAFSAEQEAFYDKGSVKTVVVVFFSATLVGIYQSWKDRIIKSELSGEQMPLKRVSLENMNVVTFSELLDN